MRACSGRKRNALTLEKLSSAFTVNELMSASRFLRVFTSASSRSRRSWRSPRSSFVGALLQRRCAHVHARADESGRDTILFCEQVVALLAHRNDRNRVRLHFHFPS